MSQSLYRKYRSRSLDEVVGQDHITKLLDRAINEGALSHAYLFTGPHGVGKTSVARILAHRLNQLDYHPDKTHLDIIEIDAASNNGVEDVRDLREKVHIAPSQAKRKVYIIDEVHMLSRQAFNALLKTLEEPPEHVIFILATTDADKLPATIVSRVQRFNFRSILLDDARQHLTSIAKSEKIKIDKDALNLVAEFGNGSFRDSIGMLDQLRSSVTKTETISRSDVERTLGVTADETVSELLDASNSGDLAELTSVIRELEENGIEANIVIQQIIRRIQSSLGENPQNLKLLEGLLSISTSSYPYMRMLIALSSNVKIESDDRQPKARKTPVKTAPTVPATKSQPKPAPAAEPTQKSIPEINSSQEFDWASLVAAAKDDIALKSLLAKSSGVLSGKTLIIYAGNKFNAGRLQSPKMQPKLHEALASLQVGELEVNILPSTAPPSDSQAAAIAAIMGGGEEVTIDG